MDIDELIMSRRSERVYDELKKVNLDKVLDALNLARYAPMAGNIFTPRFIIIKESEKKVKIAEFCLGQGFVASAQIIVAVFSEGGLAKRNYGKFAETYVRQQAGAAIQNILLKLHEQDLSACWIGAFEEEKIKKLLKVPDDWQLEVIIPVGKTPKKYKPKKVWKPDLSSVLHFEKYGQKEEKPRFEPEV